MKNIFLNDEVLLALEIIRAETHGLEFSGFGYAEVHGDSLCVYDFVLLDIGTYGTTDIDKHDLVPLASRPDARNLKVWAHMHPMGSGIPGPDNWSSTDNHTIETLPLGVPPEMMKWSASIVRTPHGWVGRFDNHLTHRTVHVPVLPELPDVFGKIEELKTRKAIHERSALWPVGMRSISVPPQFQFEDELEETDVYEEED